MEGCALVFFVRRVDPVVFEGEADQEAVHGELALERADNRDRPAAPDQRRRLPPFRLERAAGEAQGLVFDRQRNRRAAGVAEEFGLDPNRVIEEMGKIINDETRREDMKEATNIFRVLVKTLLNAGIITDRTKAFYSMYVDIDELKGEGDKMVGDDIAEEGIKYLQEINFKDRALAKILIAAE